MDFAPGRQEAAIEASGACPTNSFKFDPMNLSQRPLQRIAPAVKLGGRHRMTCDQDDCTPWFFLTWEVEPRARIFFEPGSCCRQEQNPKWVEHPIADAPLHSYSHSMKRKNFFPDQNQKPAGASLSAAVSDLNQNEIDFAPSRDEVARRAYFSYVNQGSLQGHEVQHWLAAEAELIAERKLTRVHGFHNRT